MPSGFRFGLRRAVQTAVAQILEPRCLLSATLVSDLNPAPFYGDIDAMAPVNGGVVFATREAATGEELYISDGTADGSKLLKDINPGQADSAPRYITASAGKVFFSADDGTHGRELWVTDGTADGTHIVADLAAGGGSSDPVELTDVNGTLFFVANGSGGVGIYRTDGTDSGTTLVKGGGIATPLQSYLANINGTVFFRGYDADHGYELWKTDGTADGTQLVSDVTAGPDSSNFDQIINVNGTAYFAVGSKLYKSDGTAAGTTLVEDVPGASLIRDLTSFDGLAVFRVGDSSGNASVWRSDGTANGTFELHDAGTLSGIAPDNIAVSNGVLFFGEYDADGTAALWSSDGTVAGTTLVTSFTGTFSAVQDLTDASGTLYFTGENGSLWKTDGTAAGSLELGGTNVRQITPSGTNVFFRTSSGIPSLGVSDGTPTGTVALKQFQASTQGAQIEALTTVGDKVFFTASPWALQGGNPFTTYGLYVTDGTQAGTVSLGQQQRFIQDPTGLNGSLYFLTLGSFSTSDGTPAGTLPLVSFSAGSAPPVSLIRFNDHLYFGEGGLWASDGTAAGTVQVETTADPRLIAAGTSELYFIAFDTQAHYSLWKSDGTADGTVKLADLPDGNPSGMTVIGDRLFFAIANGSQDQLWTSDGTANGTTLLRTFQANFSHSGSGLDNLVAMNGILYFHADDQDSEGLWRSDGTAAGTTLVTAFAPAAPSAVSQITALGDRIFFAAYPPAGSNASRPDKWVLWESDGTAAGTMPLAGIPLDAMSDVRWVTTAGGKLFFENYTDRLNLWESDGTAGGTQVISSSQYPAETSETPPVAIANGNIFFQSTNGAAGEALYTVPLNYSGAVARITAPSDPQLGGISSLTITFDRAVTGLSLFNLSLTRGDSPNLLTSDQTLTTADGGITWTVGNLNPVTSLPGDYALTLHATDWLPLDHSSSTGGADYAVTDSAGNPLMTDAQAHFSVIAPTSIAGTVFNDANHNGQLDPGEQGLAGWTVFIDANNNGLLDPGEVSTTTDATGSYLLSGLAPGSYVVRQVEQSGWRNTTANNTGAIAAASGQAATGPTFGNVQISTVVMDFSYLLTLAQHYNQPGTFATGDVNGDGTVTFTDLLLMAQNYGHALPSPSTTSTPAPLAAASSSLDLLLKRRPTAPRHR